MRVATVCLMLLALAACRRGGDVEHRDEGRFGSVALYAPSAGARGVVFLFSDRSGWNDELDRDARALAADGAAVVGVDLPAYLRGLAASDDGCHYLISEIEDLSKRLQRQFGFAGYRSPILAGIGAGGLLAYAALAQSPGATIAGAVSIDPAAVLATKVPLCAGAPSRAEPGGFSYGRPAALPGWWAVSPPDAVGAELRALATPARPVGGPADRLLAVVRAALPPAAPSSEAAALADLPLVALPAAHHGSVMAVLYSGDGGWRDIDKQIGEVLAARGVPVVGVDSLRYFWRARTPEETARDLARIIDHYASAWGTPRVVLIGYSFGAGILPFAYNRLPDAQRRRVVQVSLLGVEHRTLFEFRVSGWLGGALGGDAPAVLPEVQRFPPRLLQCVYGEEEEDTLCRDPALVGAEIIRTRGGHHFDGDYRALAERILRGAGVRGGAGER
jgi:type IV secretory pathway VirJ component